MTIADILAQYEETWVDVARQRDALAAMLAGIPGVKAVYGRIPPAIQSAHLPALMLFTQPARLSLDTARHLKATRKWELSAYVKQIGAGMSPDDLEQQAEPWLDVLPLVLHAYPILRLSDGRGFNIVPTGVSNVRELQMGEQFYVGCTVEFETVTQSVSMARLAP